LILSDSEKKLNDKKQAIMIHSRKKPKSLILLAVVVFIFGLMMWGYWVKYLLDGLPLKGIPLLPELLNATLALITAIGLFRGNNWSLPAGMVLGGMWIYGVTGGINLVLVEGLAFKSPIGALSDAVIFVIVLIFAVFLTAYLWKNRRLFLKEIDSG